MPDTVRTLSALQVLLADNVAGDISAQDVRDFLVSVAAATIDDTILPWSDVHILGAGAANMEITDIPAVDGASLHISVCGRSDLAANIHDICGIQLSTGGSFDEGSSYLYLAVEETDANTLKTDTAATEVTFIRLARTALTAASAAASIAGGGTAWIPGYASTTFFKTVHTQGGHPDDSATGDAYRVGQSAGVWKDAGAVDGVRVFPVNGDWDAGSSLRVTVL